MAANLTEACIHNNLIAAIKCIESGEDINKYPYLRSPLYYACKHGHIEIVKLLLSNGAEVNPDYSYKKQTPLHIACKRNHVEIVKLLLVPYKYGTYNTDALDYKNDTPFDKAFKNNHIESLRLLCETNSIDVNRKKEKYGETPLEIACHALNVELVELLIEYGANVNVSDRFGSTPLHNIVTCSDEQHIEIAKILIKHGADVNGCGDVSNVDELYSYKTPLHYACEEYNDIEMVKLLIDNGADVNAIDANNDTPLHYACKNNQNIEMVKLLIDNGANVNALNRIRKSPFIIVCERNYMTLIEPFFQCNIDMKTLYNPNIPAHIYKKIQEYDALTSHIKGVNS
jgi:ankyrin repeat protein